MLGLPALEDERHVDAENKKAQKRRARTRGVA